MVVLTKILWTLIFLFTPALIIWLTKISGVLRKIGAVILCYAAGLLLGNLHLIPPEVSPIQNLIITVSIPIALPLLLFSLDVRKFFALAGRTMLSFMLGLTALLIAVFIGYHLFAHHIHNAWKVVGMLIGVYTGGTPNLAAIQTALDVDPNTYIITHTSDTVVSIFFLLYLMTLAKKHLLKILPDFKVYDRKKQEKLTEFENSINFEDKPESYMALLKKENFKDLAIAMVLTVVIILISFLIGKLVSENIFDAVVILSITSLAIGLSFFKKVRDLKNTFQLGMYFILIFSFTVATLGKFDRILTASPYIFYYVAWTVFVSFIIHVILSAIFRVDTDTTIIVTTALTMSPPFVPVVAQSLKNKYVIISGLLVGLLGYAVGNYLGVFVAYLVK